MGRGDLMQHTQNLNLKKPDLTDNVLISDLNENMDVLDQAVGELQKTTESIGDLEKNFNEHLLAQMPHRFFDNGKWYRWGFRTVNGEPQFIYEEVIE